MKQRIIASLMVAGLLSVSLIACTPGDGDGTITSGTGTSGSTTEGTGETGGTDDLDDMTQSVNLSYYLWGGEGVSNPDVLAEINDKLTEDLNATIEIKYIDWADIGTKYPLLFTSGEQFDMTHASPGAAISYFTLASQDLLADITDSLDAVPTLRDEIPEETWATAEYNGRLYGVPTLYSEFTPYGYAYRTDLQEKHNVEPITSLETMEAYMAAVAENEDFAPLNGNSADAINLFRMFVGATDQWISAPGIPEDQIHLVYTDSTDAGEIVHPAFTDEFVAWAEKMREWAEQEFWPQDIMATQTSAKDNILNGISAGFITHMPDWTGTYGGYAVSLPDIYVDWWSPTVDNGKIIKKPGVDNTTAISSNSTNPVRALKVIEKFMTDESYYNLIQYGIEGRHYELADGTIRRPESFTDEADGFGFSVWALRNDAHNIPLESEDPVRYDLIEEWKDVAIDSPFAGFTFDPAQVTTQLSSIANVNASYGVPLMLGKTSEDVQTAVETFRDQLTNAGVEDLIAEVNAQLDSFRSGD